MKMKFLNILLIIAILVATLIPSGFGQEETDMTDTTDINETDINTTEPFIPVDLQNIIIVPNRNIVSFILCPEGQKQDHRGRCREIV
ncbi:hypothetical protein X777_16788 [Ooceraea biroi]|uniref:Secreted protein n=1 Tax=Ooceraea biroi TaxID=2015173 RepID=A0A026WUI6_OOCBI|nr:hypothetical protein X777_16788 [Ooceraea biroi]